MARWGTFILALICLWNLRIDSASPSVIVSQARDNSTSSTAFTGPPGNLSNKCGEKEIYCDEECLPRYWWMCDGFPDCSAAEDESKILCGENHTVISLPSTLFTTSWPTFSPSTGNDPSTRRNTHRNTTTPDPMAANSTKEITTVTASRTSIGRSICSKLHFNVWFAVIGLVYCFM